MEITTERADLLRALQRIDHSVEKSQLALVSRGAIRLEALSDEMGSGLQLYATDGIQVVAATSLVDIQQPGVVCVELKSLEKAVNACPEGAVKLKLSPSGSQVILTSGKHRRFVLQSLGVEYPTEQPPVQENEISFPSAILVEAVKRVVNSADSGYDRPQLSGIYLTVHAQDQVLESVALCGHNASIARTPLPPAITWHPWSCFLPNSMLKPLMELGSESEHLMLSHGGKRIYLQTEETYVGCGLPENLMDPGYWDNVFTMENRPVARVATSALVGSLRAISVVASPDRGVIVEVKDAHLCLTMEDRFGEADASDAVPLTETEKFPDLFGDNAPMVKPLYLRNALETTSPEVLISFGSGEFSSSSFLRVDSITEEGGKFSGSASTVVMQMRRLS